MRYKTIIITGASRGIGRDLAYTFAAPDVNLILIATNQEKLLQVQEICRLRGAHVICESVDVRDAQSLSKCLLEIDGKLPIDLVIANAGVSSTLQSDWQPETSEKIEQTFGINLQGMLNTIHPLIDRMITRRHGQIALVSSLAGFRGLPQSPSYCASKAAVLVYGESLRAWLSRYEVKVNVICPGYVKTDMSDSLTGPKPFLISSEKAAEVIQKGLLKNKPYIAFPWQLSVLMRLARVLPTRPINAILNRFEAYTNK